MPGFRNKNVLVLGLGESGLAVARLLSEEGANVMISDSSSDAAVLKRINGLAGEFSVKFETGGHTPGFCGDSDIIVPSPGVDIRALFASGILPEGKEVLGELEIGFMFCKAPVIAITGTNGKSTTTKLIGHILSLTGRHTVVCGNIGNPLTGEVRRITEKSVAVVEVSSFQLETIKTFRPYISILLNITPDHYYRHGGYEGYADEKFKVFKNQTRKDWAILNSDLHEDPRVRGIKSRVCFYGKLGDEGGIDRKGISVKMKAGRSFSIGKEDIPLLGIHNLENVACSTLASMIMGVDDTTLRDGIRTFKGLDHRIQQVGNFGGVTFIDDSKATNVDAAKRALESMDDKVVLIAGGRDKGGDYRIVLPEVRQKVKTMILIGEAKGKLREAFGGILPVREVSDMAEAVTVAASAAGEGGTVLLSPMCSSFDMFNDYKERGFAFQKEARKYKGTKV